MSYRGLGEKSGASALLEWAQKCKAVGGSPRIQTQRKGEKYINKVVVRCHGAEGRVKGGTITGLSPTLVSKIREQSKGKGKTGVDELRKFIRESSSSVTRAPIRRQIYRS